MVKLGFVEIATTNELTDDIKKMAKINGHELMLARVGDNYYCTDNRCPHMGGNLSHGTLEGSIDQYGWRVWVESEFGVGYTFYLTISINK